MIFFLNHKFVLLMRVSPPHVVSSDLSSPLHSELSPLLPIGAHQNYDLLLQKEKKLIPLKQGYYTISPIYQESMILDLFYEVLDIEPQYLTLTLRGGPPRPPPSGNGDCSKTHLYINLKLLDFSYISKTKILKKKKIRFFYPTPPRRGVLKK